MPVQPVVVQPIPNQPAQVQPAPVVADGNSEESALEVLDSEDELVQTMTLSPRSEQRLRRVMILKMMMTLIWINGTLGLPLCCGISSCD